MVLSAEERATIVANNKSLRNIKNELEFLADRGVLSDDAYDTIMSALPSEAPLRAGGAATASTSTPTPRAEVVASPPPAQPQANLTEAFGGLSVNSAPSPAPAPLPTRTPEPPRNQKPELCHATALYAYHAADQGDLELERDDAISVTEYMNAEWWSGMNIRTGKEGIFPKNYVRVEGHPSSISSPPPQYGYNEKASYSQPQPQYGGYPGQPVYGGPQAQYGQQNPYNNAVPPMAVANDQQPQQQDPAVGGGKGKMYAKKFGGKLGNAAIFGAGATMGADLVNSIF